MMISIATGKSTAQISIDGVCVSNQTLAGVSMEIAEECDFSAE